ncbi:MAG: peptidase U32 [Firmicutes bacterium HGW-Firmicutes-14]|nr:MAG: peptidase U32 [Firmicutes bacterium HGW-Firmicutes-14]
MRKPELLAPAGDPEKLIMAVRYGADAVYLGGEEFGLRAAAGNFSMAEMGRGIEYAHRHGARVYVTVNIFAHNRHLPGLPAYLKEIASLGADGILVSDPGIFSIARETVPQLPVHISTQANTSNWAAVEFWAQLGAKRIVLARELSLAEIREIKDRVDIELETFVHGAMCMSYSGRCLMSSYMTGRSANLGECAQPCRWKYALVEEKRPGQYYPIEEDENGSYIFNSMDLCMIEHIPELVRAGIDSLKIEGRMKSVHYVATVVSVYRKAIDSFISSPETYRFDPEWMEEIRKVSHREYTTGFFFGRDNFRGENVETSKYRRDYDFVGIVRDYLPDKGLAVIEQRNRFSVEDLLEITGPDTPQFIQKVTRMTDGEGNPIDTAPHPQQTVIMPVDNPVKPLDMLRREKTKNNLIKIRIDPKYIFFLDNVIEGYDGLAIVSTGNPKTGEVTVYVTPDTYDDVMGILENLPWPVQIAK